MKFIINWKNYIQLTKQFFFVLQEFEESAAILPEYLSADADAIRETLIFHPRESEGIEPEENSAIQHRIQDESRSSIIFKWFPTDIEQFIMGLKKCGKNFYKIRLKYLPTKTTSEITSFYYAWKRNGSEVSRPLSSKTHRYLIANTDKQRKKAEVIGSVNNNGMLTRRRAFRQSIEGSCVELKPPKIAPPKRSKKSKKDSTPPQVPLTNVVFRITA